jgi:hypothetical protein
LVFFTPPSDASEILNYQCDNHVYMGGKMTIGSASGLLHVNLCLEAISKFSEQVASSEVEKPPRRGQT